MQKTEQHYNQKIAEEIRRIAALEHNTEAAENFWQTLAKIQPQSCEVKIGWQESRGISFTLAYKGVCNKDSFDALIEGIEDKGEVFGFIKGLSPQKFHYNPQHAIESDEYFFLRFNLLKNE